MQGSYSSEQQSELDTNYMHITLIMKRIWKERNDAVWVYVEQAATDTPDKPYRQRVYRLREIGYNLFESEIMEFENPLRFAGEWKKDKPLENFSIDSLKSKEGCAVILKKVGEGIYSGATDGEKCQNTWRGAKYATSYVTIFKEGLISWDRGYTENDEYLWGAEKAGYFFKKVK